MENSVIEIDFSIVPNDLNEKTASLWKGELKGKEIRCQWVLWFDKKVASDGNISYKVTKVERPAGYDLEKYQMSGQKEKDEYEKEHSGEIPYTKQ